MHTSLFNPGKINRRIYILLLTFISLTAAQGQQVKGPLQLADQYFAAGEYYTAAGLYDQYLNPPKNQKTVSEFPLNIKRNRTASTVQQLSRKDIVYKQAESYRLAYYWNQAAALYKQCADEDPQEFVNGLYWYAICKRHLGEYTDARESLEKFIQSGNAHPDYKEAAEKELQTLQFIRKQLNRADSILFTIKKLQSEKSFEKGVFAPSFLGDHEFLVSSTTTDSVQANGINPNHSRLFTATVNDDQFDNLTALPIPSIDEMSNLGAACLSANGKYLYFTQWKKENGRIISSVYYSEKTTFGWSQPAVLPSVNKDGFNSKQPFCTPDGKYIYFSSDRPGGSGEFDIWYASLNNDGTTGTPVNTGPVINSPKDEVAPFYHNSSHTLIFSSNGFAGMGGFDLFAAKGDITNWQLPENMGNPVNSSRDDIYFYAPENTPLLKNALFSSDRGSGCCLETYKLSKEEKNKILGGILYDCSNDLPLEGAEIRLTDISGKTWKTSTNTKGEYQFELNKESFSDLTLSVSKTTYQDSLVSFITEIKDESDLLTDKLMNKRICIEKIQIPEPPVLVIKAENVVTVYFDFDRSQLKPLGIQKLDSIYQVLTDNPQITVQISGYTDGMGSEAYNKILSDKRARQCADYLIKKGIDSARITFVSFGACCPVEMEIINGRDNPDGRSLNRRALINLNKE